VPEQLEGILLTLTRVFSQIGSLRIVFFAKP